MVKIEMTLEQLQTLLNEQKQITIEKCLSHNYVYNKESTEGSMHSLPIDEHKFKEHGMKAGYPNDFQVLQRYIK